MSENAPAPGQAPLPAPNAAALLRRNASDPDLRDRAAIRFGDRVWTHGEFVAESCRWANLFLTRRIEGKPFHVAVLLDNIPEYLFAFGGAALSGATIVGLNHTRRGEHLLHDLQHTHCGLLVYEPAHRELIEPIEANLGLPDGNVLVVGDSLDDALASSGLADRGIEPDVDSIWALIFTSGTSDAPKAVICTQRRLLVTGNRMRMMLGIEPEDVGYVCMPLFHSNAVMVGWAPSVVAGASVGLARKFSASGWLRDVRHYGATYWNYTGKPLAYILATPEQPDDADNTLRVAYGNEGAPQLVEAFSKRFDVRVIDAFGATEGGVAVTRVDHAPPGALGLVGDSVKVVDEDGHELPRAEFDEHGRLVDAQGCVGEIVNTAGVGPFEGYYNNDAANAASTRNGWYWSGDLGYVDQAGFLYFAGRNADWIRVDGENFPAGPIENALARHPDVLFVAVYGVPDATAGDQVMASLVLREGASFDPAAFAVWVDQQPDVGPKWRPRYVRVTPSMPTSPTNKILKRTLVHEKYRPDRTGGDAVWVRPRGAVAFEPFGETEAKAVYEELVVAGRERFWDL
jgi:acyl-CoA synthetase (AMP-forming)/AMP-acid ligase II